MDWLQWSGWHWSKATGLLVACLALVGIVWVHSDYHWFVYADTVAFERLSYLTPEELFPAEQLEGWSIFWIEPEQIREEVLANPYVAEADVSVHLPNQVTIEVAEAEPTAIWVTEAGPMWVLADGSALEIRTSPDRPIETQLLDAAGQPLPTIVDVQRGASSVRSTHLAVDPAVLKSALTLIEKLPGLSSVRYNQGVGMNFALPGTDYWVYWGNGSNLARKLENLDLSLGLLESGEISGQVVDVRFVEHPIIR